jgi:hypothetical protein
MDNAKFKEIMKLVMEEHDKAVEKFGPFNSPHEGWAVIKEELDELWDDVKANRYAGQKNEAAQIAAMAIRYLYDVCGGLFCANDMPKVPDTKHHEDCGTTYRGCSPKCQYQKMWEAFERELEKCLEQKNAQHVENHTQNRLPSEPSSAVTLSTAVETAGGTGKSKEGFPKERDAAATDGDELLRWAAYLLSLDGRVDREELTSVQRDALVDIWQRAKATTPAVRRPATGRTDDGDCYLSWSYEDLPALSMTIEVDGGGRFAWFFRDADSGNHEETLPPQVFELLGRFSR